MKTLYIIRGISGSGKTTLANIIAAGLKCSSIIIAADDYFTDSAGNYQFVPDKLTDAHKHCQERACHAMREAVAAIIVHNTFTKHWEMSAYKLLAAEYGYAVFEIACLNNFSNVHNVPAEKVQQQKERFQI